MKSQIMIFSKWKKMYFLVHTKLEAHIVAACILHLVQFTFNLAMLIKHRKIVI